MTEKACEFLGNKNADESLKSKPAIAESSRNTEEIIIASEKRGKILNELRQVLEKWYTVKNLRY